MQGPWELAGLLEGLLEGLQEGFLEGLQQRKKDAKQESSGHFIGEFLGKGPLAAGVVYELLFRLVRQRMRNSLQTKKT